MALTLLPTELLENIIMHVLPEGFESVAVTCKKIYCICVPFIEQHNILCSRFHHFTYSRPRKVRWSISCQDVKIIDNERLFSNYRLNIDAVIIIIFNQLFSNVLTMIVSRS